jgi:hypothetical protein
VKLTTHLHLVPRSKNEWSCTTTSPIRLHGVVLIKKKQRDNFTLPLPLTQFFFFIIAKIDLKKGHKIYFPVKMH